MVAGVAACGDDGTEPVVWDVIEEVTYAEAFVNPEDDTLTVDLGQMTEAETQPGEAGVWYRDVQVGVGDTAVESDSVFISYTGWVRDGTQFDTGAIVFRFFVGDVIAGVHFGTQGQQVGGTRFIIIPPEWAYGPVGAGDIIYPGAIVLFEVRIDSIKPGTAP